VLSLLPMAKIKLLALDIDGTLAGARPVISPEVAGAITFARDQGIRIVFCTGRRYHSALKILDGLTSDEPIVIHDGAVLKDPTGDTVWARYLPPDVLPEAVALLTGMGEKPVIYFDGDDEDLALIPPDEGDDPAYVAYASARRTGCIYSSAAELARPHEKLTQICLVGRPTRLAQARDALLEVLPGGTYVYLHGPMRSIPGWLVVKNAAATKWAALSATAEGFGIKPEEIAALGDEVNDVEMIRCAGLGGATENGSPSAREAADVVVPPADENGAASFIMDHVLGGR